MAKTETVPKEPGCGSVRRIGRVLTFLCVNIGCAHVVFAFSPRKSKHNLKYRSDGSDIPNVTFILH